MPGMLPAMVTGMWKYARHHRLVPISMPIGRPIATARPKPTNVFIRLHWKCSNSSPVDTMVHISSSTFAGVGRMNGFTRLLDAYVQNPRNASQPATTSAACRARRPIAASRRSRPSTRGPLATAPLMSRPRRRPERVELRLVLVLLHEAGLLEQREELALGVDPLLVQVDRVDEPVVVVEEVADPALVALVLGGEVLRVRGDDLVLVLLPLLDAALPHREEELGLLLVVLEPVLARDERVDRRPGVAGRHLLLERLGVGVAVVEHPQLAALELLDGEVGQADARVGVALGDEPRHVLHVGQDELVVAALGPEVHVLGLLGQRAQSSASDTVVNVVIFLPLRSDSVLYGLSARTAITARAMLYLPKITDLTFVCSSRIGTSQDPIETMSAWPPA